MIAAKLVLHGLSIFVEVLSWVVFADVILSWIMPDSGLKNFTSTFAEPLEAPFRGLSEKLTKGSLPVDFSPTLALVALFLVSMLLSTLMESL